MAASKPALFGFRPGILPQGYACSNRDCRAAGIKLWRQNGATRGKSLELLCCRCLASRLRIAPESVITATTGEDFPSFHGHVAALPESDGSRTCLSKFETPEVALTWWRLLPATRSATSAA